MKTWHRVFLAVIFVFLLGCGEKNYVMEDRTDGYKGAANINPYLAAQAFLKEIYDGEVKARSGFVNYDVQTGMIISPASTLSSEVAVDKMRQWVRNGGVYVCLMERGEKHWQDVGEGCDHKTSAWDGGWFSADNGDDVLEYLLEGMELSQVSDPSGKTTGGDRYSGKPKHPVVLGEEIPLVEDVKVRSFSGEKKLQLGGTKVLKSDRNLREYIDVFEVGDYHRFLGLKHGDGRVYFITDGRLFRNPYLTMNDHASLLEDMVSEVYYGDIVFSFGKRRGFWSLMINYAGPALLGVFVLLIFWLWKSIPRVGPLLEIPQAHARDYAQSVSNTGRFLWKHKSSDVLLKSLRENVLRTSEMFNAEGHADELLMETLAEKSGLDLEEVIEALTRQNVNEAGDMVRITRNLQTIQQSL